MTKRTSEGQPLLVSIKGVNLPSKNLSSMPFRYGDGISSKSFILSKYFPVISFGSETSLLLGSIKTHPSIGLSKNFFSSFRYSRYLSTTFKDERSPSNKA